MHLIYQSTVAIWLSCYAAASKFLDDSKMVKFNNLNKSFKCLALNTVLLCTF